MIYTEHKISLNRKEIDSIVHFGGREALFTFLTGNIPPLKKLIYLLFPESLVKSNADGKIKQLLHMTNNPEGQYKTAYIRKSNGKKREIHKPDPTLKKFQKAIYIRILKDMPISSCATAYRKGASLRKATAVHIGKPVILKLDIQNFFGSIPYKTVREMFLKHGFDTDTATTLTTLVCYKGRLPQGTPTSPAISNIVIREFDEKVAEFCIQRNIAYTRYSDDMTFSGEFEKEEIMFFVEDNLKKAGFALNQKKTQFIKQGQRQTVTGVVVNKKQQLPKNYRREIRKEIHYCQKYSVQSHILHANLTEYMYPNGDAYCRKYLLHLYGKINFALQINPNDSDMLGYKEYVCQALKNVDFREKTIDSRTNSLPSRWEQFGF